MPLFLHADVSISVSYSPPPDFTLPSPPYYRPATSVTLTCTTHGVTGSVTYHWTSTCSSCFASNISSQSITESILTSSDAGLHTCTATDSSGTSASNSTEMKLIGRLFFKANNGKNCFLNFIQELGYMFETVFLIGTLLWPIIL